MPPASQLMASSPPADEQQRLDESVPRPMRRASSVAGFFEAAGNLEDMRTPVGWLP
jgi:hypothetical protein